MTSRATLDVLPRVRGRRGWPWDVVSPPLPPRRPDGGEWPTITVVTPSYNQGAYIEETIRSVLLQGYPRLEYVIFDGGSRDETVDIIRRYAPWIAHWESARDRGQSDAINKGLRRATGDLVGWLNSDDFYAPGALGALAAACGDGADWAAGACDWLAADGSRATRPSRTASSLGEWIAASQVQQPASLWRRDLHRRLGYLDERLHYVMDQELFLRFLTGGARLRGLDEVMATLRVHDRSKTGSSANTFRVETLEVIVPRYWGRLTPADRQRARRELAEKCLRVASSSAGERAYLAMARSLLGALRWAPRHCLQRCAAVGVERIRGHLQGMKD
jgi:GT2 family glycosyltransferase